MTKKPILWKVVSENLTHLGLAMGFEETWDNWAHYFQDIEQAKEFANNDYKKTRPKEDLVWIKDGEGLRTKDLGHVMYHIQPIHDEGK